jgi:hypothetical protein
MRQPLDDERFLQFARSYLRQSFPNPERIGCPPDRELQRLVESPLKADASLSEHLSCCSPCYSRYAALLEEQKVRLRSGVFGLFSPSWRALAPRLAWAAAAVILLCVSALWIFVLRAPQPTYSAFTLDLSAASEPRGVNSNSLEPVARIPQGPLDLKIHLPLGSKAGPYRVSLDAGKGVVWSHEAEARLVDHVVALQVRADLRSLPAGRYEILLQSGFERIEYPIQITRP